MLGSTLWRRKVGETFPKSAGCTLEEQKRPKVLPKGFGASLKCIVPIFFKGNNTTKGWNESKRHAGKAGRKRLRRVSPLR